MEHQFLHVEMEALVFCVHVCLSYLVFTILSHEKTKMYNLYVLMTSSIQTTSASWRSV